MREILPARQMAHPSRVGPGEGKLTWRRELVSLSPVQPDKEATTMIQPNQLIRPRPTAQTRPFRLLSLLILMLAVPAVVAAAEVDTPGARVTRVTVYADRAEAVREVTVQIPEGSSTIAFRGLPWRTEADSLRVSARGVSAVLGAVELTSEAEEPGESPGLIAARDEVERLQATIASLDAEEQTAAELREFIRALKATTAARESERLGEGSADPVSIQAVFDLVKGSLTTLSTESVKRQAHRKVLVKELEVARAKLAAERPSGPIRSRVARVEVEASQAGSLTVELMYVAPGASWRPAYRATLEAATGRVALTSEGVVRQTTGEDWSGVELSLSTAAPARGVRPPELPPLLLRPVERIARKSAGMQRRLDAGTFGKNLNVDAINEIEAITAGAAAEYGEASGGFSPIEARSAAAGVVKSAYNVAFQVPGRSDVPADGRDHRVGLRQERLDGTVAYRAVPALNEAAFLLSKTKAPSEYPLLAGPVRVFAEGAFLGSFPLKETGPGAEVTIPFGVDNRIKVERTRLPQSREERGIVGKDRIITYAFRSELENLLDRPVTVTLEDRIPVSEDERIRVEMGRETTPGHETIEDRPGILEWDLTLKPAEKREVILVYSVRFPRDLVIPGL